MNKHIPGFLFYLLLSGISVCPASGQTAGRATGFLQMAQTTLDSLYSHYGIEGEYLLREHYPVDKRFKATYLAGDDGAQGNPYSYLWPFSGTLSAAKAIYAASGDSASLGVVDTIVIPGLEQYRDTLRTPTAYASYVSTAPQSDRFYDDNIWLGIDFTDLYLLSGRHDYLDRAKEIWRFIESGTDDVLGGGVYWCEQKKESKNTCSNAPASVYALKLFEATGDSLYLDRGRDLYRWTRKMLQDPGDHLYFDNVSLDGKVSRAKYAYNSGQMMQAAALLYKLTGELSYLKDAQDIARSAAVYFFRGGEGSDSLGTFPLISKGDIWFTAVLTRGFKELYDLDGDSRYMDIIARNLAYAWNSMRDPLTGLFNEDWSGAEKRDKKWLLTQAAMVEMLSVTSEIK